MQLLRTVNVAVVLAQPAVLSYGPSQYCRDENGVLLPSALGKQWELANVRG